MRRWLTAAVLALATVGTCSLAAAGDWPRWRGPDGDDVSKETGLLKQWPDDGPKLAWDMDLPGGDSQSSVVIAEGRLYTMANVRNKGASLVCIDPADRKVLWTAKTTNKGSSNATPTVEDGL